jgi:hypothetical protein
MNLPPELFLIILAIVFGIACNGAIKMFYKYNTLLVIAYIVFLFPIALAHSLLLGLFGDNRKHILAKKVKEQVRFETLVDEEKNK